MKNLKLWQLIPITFVIWYIIIGFINWEWDWIKYLSEVNNFDRIFFIIGIMFKLILDVVLLDYITGVRKDKQSELNKQAESYSDKRGLDEYNKSKER